MAYASSNKFLENSMEKSTCFTWLGDSRREIGSSK